MCLKLDKVGTVGRRMGLVQLRDYCCQGMLLKFSPLGDAAWARMYTICIFIVVDVSVWFWIRLVDTFGIFWFGTCHRPLSVSLYLGDKTER